LTICPCCGFKFHGALSNGCKQCGARAVGEPLPKPAQELPSYGRALVLAVTGSLVVLVFVTQTLLAFIQRFSGEYGFWKWVAAGETAAWRLKWVSIPVLFAILWFGRKLYRSILLQPQRYCGVRYARNGLLASSVVTLLIALLIGITVPARMEQRRLSKEAAIRAQGYALERALTEYKIKYKTYPADLRTLLERIPDPDGTLAAAVLTIDPNAYHPSVDVAANSPEKARPPRGSAIRNASFSRATDDLPSGGLSFTNYALVLPGEDKITGNEDDWIVAEGMIRKQSEIAKGSVGRSVSAGVLQR
jgi:type II secretory pathway pseudopilin PulG